MRKAELLFDALITNPTSVLANAADFCRFWMFSLISEGGRVGSGSSILLKLRLKAAVLQCAEQDAGVHVADYGRRHTDN